MRMRKKKREAPVSVILSPLIDCVFLLLIFFLVTSMLKRYERMIPITLADPSATIAPEAVEDVYQMALDRGGTLSVEAGKGKWGSVDFKPVADAPDFLASLATERGVDRPLQVRVQPGTPFQTVIRMQDLLELHQFENFRFRIADRGDELQRSEK